MTDDWSLKDKGVKLATDLQEVYLSAEINKLRLKLIEDIERIPMWKLMPGALENIKNLINKRFGVE